MQIILVILYIVIGLMSASLGMRYDMEKRPGRKATPVLFAEFVLVTILWPGAVLLGLVAVCCLRIAHHLNHKK